jgi:hypothetical protein
MIKNQLLIVSTLAFIPIPLIWSSAIKSVIAETSLTQTLETQETQESNIEVDDEAPEQKKAPAPPADTTEIPKTSTQNPSTQFGVESFSTTASKTRSYSSKLAETKGARAACSLISWKTGSAPADNNAEISCSIKDIGNDGDSVYVDWWLDGYGSVRLTNTKGYGTVTNETDSRKVPSDAIGHAYWRVCRNVSFWPDNCSETKSWKVN